MKNTTPTLQAAKLHSGFSGSDNSAVMVDLLFAGHVPQADLLAHVKTALNAHAGLVEALRNVTEHCRITINEYRRFANEHGKDAIHPLDDKILAQARSILATLEA